MKEHHQRQEAISRYLKGEKIVGIALYLKKSRKWVHHWIKRYKADPCGANWFIDKSKAPKKTAALLDSETEAQILFIRKELDNEKMAQTGAISIQYEFERRGLKPVPAVWTINRVIAKHGMNKHKQVYKIHKDYPELFWHTHQLDLVGPRYIKGDGKFYSINLIDITTHSCITKAVRDKSSAGIVQVLASFWENHGLPDALQLDNELSFRGSNRYPRSFGSVVRFALSQGVAVVFIPLAEPWRNGIIEKFNDTYQKKFIHAHHFKNLEDLSLQEKNFIDFHNKNHRYSSQGHKTPDEMSSTQLPPVHYKGMVHLEEFTSGKVNIPLVKGSVYFIRFIRSDLKLHLPGESFIVKQEMKYSYIIAEVNIDNHSLIIWQNNGIIQVFGYTIVAVNW
jgi:hypothetical protein